MKPLLAASTDGKDLTYPLLASPKLDGVRVLIVNGKVMSRSMKLIPNKHVQKLFGKPEYHGLDGELIVGAPTDKDCYRNTTSGVMSIEGEPEVKLWAFDIWGHGGLFHQRLYHVERRVNALSSKSSPLAFVHHHHIRFESELLEFETKCLELGYEGVMLRHPNGLYKQGRSTLKEGTLLKLKRFVDSEAEILGFEELMHNSNEKEVNELGQNERSSKKAGMVPRGCLGALLVRDVHSGVEFSIGTGFTQVERQAIWDNRQSLFDKFIKYKSFLIGVKDKPRFPVFLGFRNKIDIFCK